MAMLSQGMNQKQVAQELGVAWSTVDLAQRFSVTGDNVTAINQQRKRRDQLTPLYIELADEVARLVEQEGLTQREIANQLSISLSTVISAWRKARPDAGDMRKCSRHQTRIKRARPNAAAWQPKNRDTQETL